MLNLGRFTERDGQKASPTFSKVEELTILEMIGIKPVRGEEHGEHQEDVPICHKDFEHAHDLRFPGRVLHHDDAGAVVPADKERVAEEHSQDKACSHKDNEGHVGAVLDFLARWVIQSLAERNERANNGSEVEDTPEGRDVLAL